MSLHDYSNVHIFLIVQGICFSVAFAFFFLVTGYLHW